MPTDFEANIEKYAANEAIVFEGTDFFMVWLLLMTKSYKTLASHYLDFDHRFNSKEEIIAFLKSRLKPITA